MVYARFHAALNQRAPDGARRRAHLEAAARTGSAFARQQLEEPEFPVALTYLWGWVHEIRQGLGVGMDGLASLTWTALEAWQRLTDRLLQPHEVEAVFAVDAALRWTGDDEPTASPAPRTTPRPMEAWPVKKGTSHFPAPEGV